MFSAKKGQIPCLLLMEWIFIIPTSVGINSSLQYLLWNSSILNCSFELIHSESSGNKKTTFSEFRFLQHSPHRVHSNFTSMSMIFFEIHAVDLTTRYRKTYLNPTFKLDSDQVIILLAGFNVGAATSIPISGRVFPLMSNMITFSSKIK